MSAATATTEQGLSVNLPEFIELGHVRLYPHVSFQMLITEPRKLPEYKEVALDVVEELINLCDRPVNNASQIPLTDIARYADTQFHSHSENTVLAVRRVVTFEGTNPETGDRVVMSSDRNSVQAWLSDRGAPQFFSQEEARNKNWAGKNALAWATVDGVEPSRVVWCRDSFFRPCGMNDIGIQVTKR